MQCVSCRRWRGGDKYGDVSVKKLRFLRTLPHVHARNRVPRATDSPVDRPRTVFTCSAVAVPRTGLTITGANEKKSAVGVLSFLAEATYRACVSRPALSRGRCSGRAGGTRLDWETRCTETTPVPGCQDVSIVGLLRRSVLHARKNQINSVPPHGFRERAYRLALS